MNLIANLLREVIGLHAPTVGSPLVERAVRSRMHLHGLTRQEDYRMLLEHSPAEWETLIESVVITETWFFRDRTPFLALAELVADEWLPAHPGRTLRLLSVPCASGEEPFSLAMSLLDAGLPKSRFSIDAYDLSAGELAHARRAVYRKNSFRGRDLSFRSRYFVLSDEGHVLNPLVRRQVRFHRGNILDDRCLPGADAYDYIFCRNLLIYFDAATQARTLAKLRRLLSPSGALFVGPAEMPLAMEHGFAPTNLPLSFACRKSETVKRLLPPPPRISKSRLRATSLRAALKSAAARPPRNADSVSTTAPPPAARASLNLALRLARDGQLNEAAEICETHLRDHGACAEAFYLLGLVRHAAGADAQAGEFYRKALYLQPDHYESLLQWASLSQRNGNGDHARILKKRAARLKNLT